MNVLPAGKCMYNVFMSGIHRGQKKVGFPRTGVIDTWELPYGAEN